MADNKSKAGNNSVRANIQSIFMTKYLEDYVDYATEKDAKSWGLDGEDKESTRKTLRDYAYDSVDKICEVMTHSSTETVTDDDRELISRLLDRLFHGFDRAVKEEKQAICRERGYHLYGDWEQTFGKKPGPWGITSGEYEKRVCKFCGDELPAYSPEEKEIKENNYRKQIEAAKARKLGLKHTPEGSK